MLSHVQVNNKSWKYSH